MNRFQKMITLLAGLALLSQLCACGLPATVPQANGKPLPLETAASASPDASASPAASASPDASVSTSWNGVGATFTSVVNQTMSNETDGSFTEVLTFKDGTVVNTVGTLKYDAAAGTNVYTYTQPKAAVVKVSTEEKDDGNTTIDTVTESDSEFFKVGDKITYTKK